MFRLLIIFYTGLVWIPDCGYAVEMQLSPALVTVAGTNAPEVKMTCALPQNQATSDIFTVLNMNIEREADTSEGFVTIASKLGDQLAILNDSNTDVVNRHPDVIGASHIGDSSAENVFELSMTWKPGTIQCTDAMKYRCTINFFEKVNGNYNRVTVQSTSELVVHKNQTNLDLAALVNGLPVKITAGGMTDVTGAQPGDIIDLVCSGSTGPYANASISWFYNSPTDGANMVTPFVPSANDSITDSTGNFSSTDCLYDKYTTLRYQVRDSDASRTDKLGFRCGTDTTLPNSQTQTVWSGGAVLDIEVKTTTPLPTSSTAGTTATTTTVPPGTVATTVSTGVKPTDTSDGLVCLSCTSISQPRHCHTVEKCLPDQYCGIDLTVDRFGDVYYDVGCKNKDTCKAKRASGTSCSECCDTDLCNVKGCGEAGYPETTGPVCYSCDLLPSGRFCHRVDICDKHEACFIEEVKEFGDILVTTGCRSEQTCHELSGSVKPVFVGKRSEEEVDEPEDARNIYPSCIHCCSNAVCNTKCDNSSCVDTTTTCPYLIQSHNICADPSTAITCPLSCGLCAAPPVTTANVNHPQTAAVTNAPIVQTTSPVVQTTPPVVQTTSTVFQTTTSPKPQNRDCQDIHTNNASAPSGKYEISIGGQDFKVSCDMTDNGGGWTVFQKRFDGSVDFNRSITDYKNGFGDISGEFWLGLDKLYELTNGTKTELMVGVTDYTGGTSYEEFGSFSVGPGPDYTLHLQDRVGGNAFGRLTDYDGANFSTYDMDQDASNTTNCADQYQGGFWYDACIHTSNVNGLYKPGLDFECKFKAMAYTSCDGIKAIEMKFRRT